MKGGVTNREHSNRLVSVVLVQIGDVTRQGTGENMIALPQTPQLLIKYVVTKVENTTINKQQQQ